jgi:PAS domain S-box-containing protein
VAARLTAAGYTVREAADGASALQILETEPGYDVVLTDLKMPSLDGFGLLDAVRSRGLNTDVIVLTGTHEHDPRAAVRAFRLGAADFLTKSAPQEALAAVDQALERRRHRAELREAEDALRRSERQLNAAQHLAHVGSWELDLDAGEVTWSDELYRIHGLSPAERDQTPPMSLFWVQIHPEDRERVKRVGDQAIHDGLPFSYDFRIVRHDGQVRTLHSRGEVLVDGAGRPIRLVGADQDVTDMRDARSRLEVKTIQLEAVAEAMMRFLGSGDLAYAARPLLEAALRLTASREGCIASVGEGRTLQVVTSQGEGWADRGRRERTVVGAPPALDRALARPIMQGQALLSNHPANDPRCEAWMEICPSLRCLLVLPLRAGEDVVGVVAVANRDGGFGIVEAASLDVLSRACGVLLDSCRRARREVVLEEQLRQAQKMEAVGRLAGGIAHDFNNVLGVISGLAEIVQRGLSVDDERHVRVDGILKATVRAAALTRQLLAFSRQQVPEPAVIDVNRFVSEMRDMAERIVGEDIELGTELSSELWPVKMDQSQLEQIIMNLIVNARDAMPGGGRLLVRTENVEMGSAFANSHLGARPGLYVLLSVVDSGTGMDAETLSHIFEPFYTTKRPEMGTGLGLATVYGIVKQSAGYIDVASEPGSGTTFRIYLPRTEKAARSAATPRTVNRSPVATQRKEKVLVVEDDEALRDVICQILTSHGYAVSRAAGPDEAIRLIDVEPDCALMLTDVVMPGMNGLDLARRLVQRRPGLKVMFMSGYSDSAVLRDIAAAGAVVLPKPFSAEALAAAVCNTFMADVPKVDRVAVS